MAASPFSSRRGSWLSLHPILGQAAECRKVALGDAVQSLDQLVDHIHDSEPVIAFVQRQLSNRRSAVQRKVAAFLKKHKGSAAFTKWRSWIGHKHRPDFTWSAQAWQGSRCDVIVGDEAFWLLTGFASKGGR